MIAPSQQPFKIRDYNRTDTIDRSGERVNYGASVHQRTFIEGYIEGEVEVHLHFLVRINGCGSVPRKFCAVLQREGDRGQVKGNEVKVFSTEAEPNKSRSGHMSEAMFIISVKHMETPQRVCCNIPSVVRLQALDNCLTGWIDHPKLPLPPAVKLGASLGNKELTVLGDWLRERSTLPFEGELIHGIIKAGPEVMDTLSDEDSPFGRRLLPNHGSNHILPGIGVEFVRGAVSILFDPPLDHEREGVQVLFRSLDLHEGTSKTRHGLTSEDDDRRTDADNPGRGRA